MPDEPLRQPCTVWLPFVVVCDVLVVVVVVVLWGVVPELDGVCATATVTASSRMDVSNTAFLMQLLRRLPALGRAALSQSQERLLKTS